MEMNGKVLAVRGFLRTRPGELADAGIMDKSYYTAPGDKPWTTVGL